MPDGPSCGVSLLHLPSLAPAPIAGPTVTAIPDLTLAEAREQALENRRAAYRDEDPRGATVPVFADAAEKVMARILGTLPRMSGYGNGGRVPSIALAVRVDDRAKGRS